MKMVHGIRTVHGITVGIWPEPVWLPDQASYRSCVDVSPQTWDQMIREVTGH